MNYNRCHVSQKPCLIHYIEKLHMGWFLCFWDFERGKTTGVRGWTGVDGQEARQPTTPLIGFLRPKLGEASVHAKPMSWWKMQSLPPPPFHQTWVLSAAQAVFPRSRPRDEVSHHSTRDPVCGRDPTSEGQRLTGWYHPVKQKERLYNENHKISTHFSFIAREHSIETFMPLGKQ